MKPCVFIGGPVDGLECKKMESASLVEFVREDGDGNKLPGSHVYMRDDDHKGRGVRYLYVGVNRELDGES